MRLEKIYKVTAFISCVFLVLTMNPFILWLTWPPIINIPSYILVFICFFIFLGIGQLNFSNFRIKLAFLILCFAIQATIPLLTNVIDYGRFVSFLAFLLIIFFPSKTYIYIYKYLLLFFWFISLCSIIVFIPALFFDLPHIRITNSTLILQDTDYYYKLYGFIVSFTNTVYHIAGLNIARVCGVFREPGHFATYLGVIIFWQKLFSNKISRVIFIAGILTFSPVFYISLLIVFLYDVVLNSKKGNFKKYFFGTIGLIIIILMSSQNFLDQIWELAIGRNLGNSLSSRLDERANEIAIAMYEQFSKTNEVWFGRGAAYVDELGLLSDFRGFIFKYGIIGLIFSLASCIVLLLKSKSKNLIFLFAPYSLLIYLQRSWMFGSIYIYMFLLITVLIFINNYSNEKKLRVY